MRARALGERYDLCYVRVELMRPMARGQAPAPGRYFLVTSAQNEQVKAEAFETLFLLYRALPLINSLRIPEAID